MTQSACSPNSLNADTGIRSVSCCPFPEAQYDAGAYNGIGEPTLPDLMDDPVLRRLMASDGVRLDSLLALIADTRLRLAAG